MYLFCYNLKLSTYKKNVFDLMSILNYTEYEVWEMKGIKLIAIDIGGTLLSDDNKISKRNIDAINRAQKHGIKIALITARMYSSTKYISKTIKSDYGIFGNGNVVMNLKNRKLIYKSYINKDMVQSLITFAKNNELYIHISRILWEVSDENKYFALKHNILNKNYPNNLKSNIIVVDNLYEYCKKHSDVVNSVFVSSKNMDSIIKKIKKEFPNLFITEYNKNLYEHAINKTINYVEVSNNIRNKSDGLIELINHLKIASDEVLVIGDGINDIEMFNVFNNSGCASNSNEMVKKIAGYVSEYSNNQSAVSDIINYYLGKGEDNI